MSMNETYDVVIIGAGLSGLASGVRLAHFEKKVLIVEAHALCGGLNSWYRRQGEVIDVGLHAMTNFIPKGGGKGPLTKLMRQLRLTYDDLDLHPQACSKVTFPGTYITFSNDFSTLTQSVATHFPEEIDGFDKLSHYITEFNEVDLNPPDLSARDEIRRFITSPVLTDMLLTPLMFYGNADEHDMDFAQFAIMWKSIYCSGFARPANGMRHMIELLMSRFKDSGGELWTNAPVKRLNVENDTVRSIHLSDGRVIHAETVLSCAGHNETMRLLPDWTPMDEHPVRTGKLSFVEQIFFLDRPVSEFGLTDSIVFFNHSDSLEYNRPDEPVDYTNGVICCPGNFTGSAATGRHELRVTLRASYPQWQQLADQSKYVYNASKDAVTDEIITRVGDLYAPGLRDAITFSDLFTPLTIERFTGHIGGAVYGSPDKQRLGQTSVSNLTLIGTDQGFLGIVGAMLSGITIANRLLSPGIH